LGITALLSLHQNTVLSLWSRRFSPCLTISSVRDHFTISVLHFLHL